MHVDRVGGNGSFLMAVGGGRDAAHGLTAAMRAPLGNRDRPAAPPPDPRRTQQRHQLAQQAGRVEPRCGAVSQIAAASLRRVPLRRRRRRRAWMGGCVGVVRPMRVRNGFRALGSPAHEWRVAVGSMWRHLDAAPTRLGRKRAASTARFVSRNVGESKFAPSRFRAVGSGQARRSGRSATENVPVAG